MFDLIFFMKPLKFSRKCEAIVLNLDAFQPTEMAKHKLIHKVT